MCGILGVLRKHNTYEAATDKDHLDAMKKYFTRLLFQSKSRGADSTGVFVLNDKNSSEHILTHNPEITMLKDYVDSHTFIQSEKFNNLYKKIEKDTFMLVGHTRAATSGDPSRNINNHPFLCGRVLGVHNGVIKNWKEAAAKNNIVLKSECDSEIIFALLDKFIQEGNSTQQSIQKMSNELEGWMACAYVDINCPRELVLFRKDAPLAIRSVRNNNLIMFASDDAYIKNAICADTKGTFQTMESVSGVLDNNSGIVIKSFGEYEWLTKVYSFTFSQKAAA